jgi:hypothetical protein
MLPLHGPKTHEPNSGANLTVRDPVSAEANTDLDAELASIRITVTPALSDLPVPNAQARLILYAGTATTFERNTFTAITA